MADTKNYRILDLVATGGTAVLYRAIQTSLDRAVAIKKLHQHLTEDENFTRRFVLEAKAAASLDHENIVKIIDFGNDEDSYYMVMEFIEGESLRVLLDRWKQFPLEIALAVAYQVCQGLEHAHSKGIVHRDVKPGNIMVTRSGRIKITDFGLAKLTQTTTQHTAENSILGTPLYMSPEQAFGQSVDHRSDLFSLGTLLYEMLTGIQPFQDDNYMGVIHNIINRNAPHPSKFDMDIPANVQSIVGKAMNKNRDARFQGAGDFKKAIERSLGLERLKGASESVRSLLASDGATMVLPVARAKGGQGRRLRGGFVTGLVLALLAGGIKVGYSLVPDVFDQQLGNVIDWVDSVRSRPPRVQAADSGDAVLLPGLPSVVSQEARTVRDTSSLPAADTTAVLATLDDVVVTRPAAADSDLSPEVPMEGTSPAPTSTAETPPAEPPPVETVAKGWLAVTADPWGELYIDGSYRGDAAPTRRIELDKGPHTLECRNPKYKTYTEVINVTAGELSTRNIVLEKLMGSLKLTTTDGAEVYLDGVLVGNSPLANPLELDAGRHLLTVKKAGYHVWNNEIIISAGELMPLSITLSPMY